MPADRRRDGAVMKMSVRENLTLPRMRPLRRRSAGSTGGPSDGKSSAGSRRIALRPAEPERTLELFSGGNQQKVVLAKWLRNEPQVLLLDEPTQGVDVGAKAGIYRVDRRAPPRPGRPCWSAPRTPRSWR